MRYTERTHGKISLLKIRFDVHCHTEWGQQMFIAGSIPELGSWDADKAKPMEYFWGDHWKAELPLSQKDKIEFDYQYLIKHDQGMTWLEGSPKRKFASAELPASLRKSLDLVVLQDIWQKSSDPGHLFLTSAFSKVIFNHPSPEKDAAKTEKKAAEFPKKILRLKVVAPRVSDEHTLCVTGSITALGNWDIDKSLPMNAEGFPVWTLDLDQEACGSFFAYKYILKDKNSKLVLYEDGPDRIFKSNGGADSECGVPEKSSARKLKAPKQLTVVSDYHFRYPHPWKGAGLAVPVFSLRSARGLGVGEFLDLKSLADWAHECGLQIIQILPVNDTSSHLTWRDSYPYSPISVFALHPIYINLEALGEIPKEMSEAIAEKKKVLNGYDHVNYEEVMSFKIQLLKQLFTLQKEKFLASPGLKAFLEENSFWLAPYAAFCFLRDKHGTSDFSKWGEYARITEKDIQTLTHPKSKDYDAIAFHYFVQYHLHLQLSEAVDYARSRQVVLKGDIPIGLDKHSDSCWTSPELFNMTQSAGAPPDPFSEAGQNWGFPTYNWDAMIKNDFLWWRQRLQQMSRYFQMVRLDHVLGFFRIWEIPESFISGLMGHFNPAIPLWKDELERQGIWDFNRLSEPHITSSLINIIFGLEAGEIRANYMDEYAPGKFRLKPEFSTQKQIEAHLVLPENASAEMKEKYERFKMGLFTLISDLILLKDPSRAGFHPRINMKDTFSFLELEPSIKTTLEHLYNDYFYHRQEDFWRRQAMIKLPALMAASEMLICGEDLGMVPDCVPEVMKELSLLGLRIQRMPKETDREFGVPKEYPYLTVCTTASHDCSPLRAWWEENRVRTQLYYNTILWHRGEAPLFCEPHICQEIIVHHLESPSMLAIFPIQDILAMSSHLRRPGDPKEEQINNPANPHHYWKFRLHISLEDLLAQKEFNAQLRSMMANTGRYSVY